MTNRSTATGSGGASSREDGETTTGVPLAGRPVRLLLVEDNPGDVGLFEARLREAEGAYDLNVDGLKIDMSFVHGLRAGRGDAAIVQATLTLGKEMDVLVVAEEVETTEQLRLLREMSCELGQGFLFSRTLPPEEVPRLLASGPVDTTGG